MIKRILQWFRRVLLMFGILGLLAILLPRLITNLYAVKRIYQVEGSPAERVAIVFGAGLRGDGTATPILRDRVESAANLYFDGKVEKILISGDNRFEYYNEPDATIWALPGPA